MSIYSNVTEQDLIKLRKLAEQQKEQRALKSKNRILKQTHDVNLAESLSPITNKLDGTSKKLGDIIKESTQNLGDVIKETNSPQPAIENTPTALPIENEKIQPRVIYDTSLGNTLSNMRKNTGFLKKKKQMMVKFFGTDLQLKKWVLINLYPMGRFIT